MSCLLYFTPGFDLIAGFLGFNTDWKNREPGYKFPPKAQVGVVLKQYHDTVGALIFYLRI